MKSYKIFALVLVLAVALAGCGEKPGDIKLNTGSVTLKSAGATSTLLVSAFDKNGKEIPDPKMPVAWSTSDPNVATVTAGTVKAVGSGKATVTATMGELTASATINVQIVQSVTLSPAIANMKPGDHTNFGVVVKDEKGKTLSDAKVVWKIGNTSVASVSGAGKVTAIKEGDTVVKAIVGDKMAKAAIKVLDTEKDDDSKATGMKKEKKATGLKKKEIKKAAGLKKKKK